MGGHKNKFRCTPAFSFRFVDREKEPTDMNTDLLNGITLCFPVVWETFSQEPWVIVIPNEIHVLGESKTETEVTLRLGKSNIYKELWSLQELLGKKH